MKKVILSIITLATLAGLSVAAPFQTLGLLRTPDAYLLPHKGIEILLVGYYRNVVAPSDVDPDQSGFIPYGMLAAGILDRVQLGMFVGDEVYFMNAKLKVLTETERFPQLTVGMDNMFSPVNRVQSQLYHDPAEWEFADHPDKTDYEHFSPYFVLSKRAVLGGINWMFNLGLGLSRYYGQVPRSQFFKGAFTSIEIFPWKNIALQGEYDGKDFNFGLKYAYKDFAVRVGAQATEDWAKGSEGNGYEGNARLAIGFSYQYKPGVKPSPPPPIFEPVPEPTIDLQPKETQAQPSELEPEAEVETPADNEPISETEPVIETDTPEIVEPMVATQPEVTTESPIGPVPGTAPEPATETVTEPESPVTEIVIPVPSQAESVTANEIDIAKIDYPPKELPPDQPEFKPMEVAVLVTPTTPETTTESPKPLGIKESGVYNKELSPELKDLLAELRSVRLERQKAQKAIDDLRKWMQDLKDKKE